MKNAIIILVCLLALPATWAAAGENLRVAVDDDFPPFSFSNNGVPMGIDVDIVRELGRRMGIDVTITLMPWKRLLDKTTKGELHAAMSLFRTEEREKFAIFIHPIHYSTFVLFVKKGNEFPFEALSDLYGKKIMKEAGFSVDQEFDTAVNQGKIHIQEIFQSAGVFHFIVNGHYDAFVNNLEVTLYKMAHTESLKRYADQITYLPRPVRERGEAFLVLSRNSELKNKDGLARSMRHHLIEMEAQGIYRKAIQRYVRRMK